MNLRVEVPEKWRDTGAMALSPLLRYDHIVMFRSSVSVIIDLHCGHFPMFSIDRWRPSASSKYECPSLDDWSNESLQF